MRANPQLLRLTPRSVRSDRVVLYGPFDPLVGKSEPSAETTATPSSSSKLVGCSDRAGRGVSDRPSDRS